jgi:hypothetical protein
LFYEALISGADLPQFGVDIPVLRIVFQERVYFDTDQTTIRPEASKILDLIAENLRRDVPDVALFVAGHADRRGTDEYNYLLSVDRADVVARALVGRGIGSTRIWRIGFGEAVPIAPSTDEKGLALNRRVEFLLAARAEAVAVWLSRQSEVCADVDPHGYNGCLRKIASLPPLTAEPVSLEAPTEVEVLEERDDALLTEQRQRTELRDSTAIVFDGHAGEQVETSEETRTTVEIAREDRVIIDLKETRVEVGVPKL